LNGARLVIAPAGRPDPSRIGQLIAAREVTFMAPSTGVFHELVRVALPNLGGLRLATPGGDVLSPEAARLVREAHPSVRLLNSYGPTEATILACCIELDELDGTPIPIGRPLPGYSVYVLDEGGRPVEDGATGEIWIGGPGVARGYRGDPVRTAERFRPNPYGLGSMYGTGDRGRVRSDGELMFLGRLDRQVKIAGQRLELGRWSTPSPHTQGWGPQRLSLRSPSRDISASSHTWSPQGNPPPGPPSCTLSSWPGCRDSWSRRRS